MSNPPRVRMFDMVSFTGVAYANSDGNGETGTNFTNVPCRIRGIAEGKPYPFLLVPREGNGPSIGYTDISHISLEKPFGTEKGECYCGCGYTSPDHNPQIYFYINY